MTFPNSAEITKVRAHDSFKIFVAKYSDFRRHGLSHMTAAGLGIEPKFSLSESDVLPLDDPAMYSIVHLKYLKNREYSSIAFMFSDAIIVHVFGISHVHPPRKSG